MLFALDILAVRFPRRAAQYHERLAPSGQQGGRGGRWQTPGRQRTCWWSSGSEAEVTCAVEMRTGSDTPSQESEIPKVEDIWLKKDVLKDLKAGRWGSQPGLR